MDLMVHHSIIITSLYTSASLVPDGSVEKGEDELGERAKRTLRGGSHVSRIPLRLLDKACPGVSSSVAAQALGGPPRCSGAARARTPRARGPRCCGCPAPPAGTPRAPRAAASAPRPRTCADPPSQHALKATRAHKKLPKAPYCVITFSPVSYTHLTLPTIPLV